MIEIGIAAVLVAIGVSINLAIYIRTTRRERGIRSIQAPRKDASEANVARPISPNSQH